LNQKYHVFVAFKKANHELALAVALAAGLGLARPMNAQDEDTQLAKDLVGTWVLVGKPGAIAEAPAAGGRIKMLTGAHWSATQSEPKTGVVLFHHGGVYTLHGNEYVESVEYANESTREFIGKKSVFTVKIEGDTLTQTGVGNPWNEVWKRAKSIKPRKSDATFLQGAWSGKEIGPGARGSSSLAVHGTTFEFHGADPKEWYKAAFSVYDTTPKQLVITVTDASSHEYAGLASYAICQLADGALTVTGNEPGNPVVPASFDAPGARKFVFRQK
jgi:hypothetical protein